MKTALNRIEVIAFDADDTLWHNEGLYLRTQEKFKQLLTTYHGEEWIDRKLYETETRNLQHFGYGIKGFTLSMIETAIELTEGRISGAEISKIMSYAREMLAAPVELLDGVRETVAQLAETHQLMLITKGDLFDQETKIARSGIGGYFKRIEIVREKNRETYEAIARRHGITPESFLMVGNSLKSDILPVAAMGALAVYVPYQTTWQHERVSEEELRQVEYIQLEHINLLPALLNGG
jgi:putative hydrolase of the HAD superfamily